MAGTEEIVVVLEIFPAWRGPTKDVPVPAGITLGGLTDLLEIPGDTEAVMVNGAYVAPDYRLQNGDRVMVIPFMSGG